MLAFISASSSLVSLSMVSMAVEGNFTFDGLFSFGTFMDDHWTVAALSIYFMMGVIGGLLGALFNKMNTLLTQWRMKNVRTFRAGLGHAVGCGLIVTLVALASMFIIDDCRPESGMSDVVIRLQCGQGQEHAAAAIWFATPERILQVRLGCRNLIRGLGSEAYLRTHVVSCVLKVSSTICCRTFTTQSCTTSKLRTSWYSIFSTLSSPA